MANTTRPPAVRGLSELASDYRVLLCDVWGVMHNGHSAHRDSNAALARFRAEGGAVVLLTNAPRRKSQVLIQFERFGVDPDAFDDVVTSGESARDYLRARPGSRVFHLGPERDLSIYEDLSVELVSEADAELVVCTGLFDDEAETPSDYAPRFAPWVERKLPMLCVNPDKVVERGPRLVWCAGALAEAYEAMKGQTLIVGKPHEPIYATALARIDEIVGEPVDRRSVLAIGDGGETDIRGANREGLDALFVSGGIHADEFGARENPDGAAISAFLDRGNIGARATIPLLRW